MIYKSDSGILYEQLVNKIESQIADGILQQGDKLPSENALAKENNISRVTVRQALKLLSEMGLIETRKGIGSFVAVSADPNGISAKVNSFLQKFEDNFKQAIQIKILIEPAIAKNAAQKADPKDVERMAEIWQEMSTANTKKHYNKLCILFHLALVATAKNPLLSEIYQKLEQMEHMYLRDLLLPAEKSKKLRIVDIEQHGKILHAIQDHNAELAYLYCFEHLQYFYNYYEDLQNSSEQNKKQKKEQNKEQDKNQAK